MVYNNADVKQLNLDFIRGVIKAKPGSTKADIAGLTGLSHATCNNLLNEMVLTGEVKELGEESNSGGRPSKRYEYNREYLNMLCVTINHDQRRISLTVGIFDAIGEKKHQETLSVENFSTQMLLETIVGFREMHPSICAVGIGIPGVVMKERYIKSCDVGDLNDCPLADLLEEKLKIPVVLENDMNATAIGYYRDQDFQEETSVAVITFIRDNCPGAGIIAEGNILRGNSYFAGEVANLPYPWTMEQMEEMFRASATAVPVIIQSLCALTAIINPERIVLTGSLMKEEMLSQIENGVLKRIQREHLPRIIIIPDTEGYYLSGLMNLVSNRIKHQTDRR